MPSRSLSRRLDKIEASAEAAPPTFAELIQDADPTSPVYQFFYSLKLPGEAVIRGFAARHEEVSIEAAPDVCWGRGRLGIDRAAFVAWAHAVCDPIATLASTEPGSDAEDEAVLALPLPPPVHVAPEDPHGYTRDASAPDGRASDLATRANVYGAAACATSYVSGYLPHTPEACDFASRAACAAFLMDAALGYAVAVCRAHDATTP
jgi:hypothetical protein